MTPDNPIDWLQETIGGRFPEKVEALLKLIAGHEKEIELSFNIAKKMWRFRILDFKSLHSNMEDPAYTIDDPDDRMYNPYFLVHEIKERCEGIPEHILPFAEGFLEAGMERMLVYFKPNDSTVYACNINNAWPITVLAADAEELLGSIDGVIKRIDEKEETWIDIYPPMRGAPFHELVPEENRFVEDAKCTHSAKGYKSVVESLMGITDGLLTLESFNGIEGDLRVIQVTINGISGEFTVEGNTRYIDSAALVRALNALLEPVLFGHFFIDVDQTEGDWVQVAFGDQATYELLLKNQIVAEWQMNKS